MTHRFRTLMLLVLGGAIVIGPTIAARQQSPSSQPPVPSAQPPSAETTQAAAQTGEYLIGPEDLLEIVVWRQAELSRTVAVRPDGRTSPPRT